MIISETKSFIDNGTTYSSINIVTENTNYSFIKVAGKFNYINIKNNLYGRRSMGKDFKSFDEAQANYKNAKIKSMILLADSIL